MPIARARRSCSASRVIAPRNASSSCA
jgi:hypothetical protein